MLSQRYLQQVLVMGRKLFSTRKTSMMILKIMVVEAMSGLLPIPTIVPQGSTLLTLSVALQKAHSQIQPQPYKNLYTRT